MTHIKIYEGNFVVDDFVTVSYDRKFYPGQTKDFDKGSFKVSKMARTGKYWKRLELQNGI
jgi:hypothetical protein